METGSQAEAARGSKGSGIGADRCLERCDAAVPMQHQGEAWDVARAALFLASDESKFVTGVTLPVDGGSVVQRVVEGRYASAFVEVPYNLVF